MKTSTIWESAGRPLFVRSVWLETANVGRTHRRHFILDYELKERDRVRSSVTSPTRKRKSDLRPVNSCDEYDNSEYFNNSLDYLEERILLGTTKLTLQQQQQNQLSKCKSTRASRRRNLVLGTYRSSSNFRNYIHAGRKQDLHELYSRRSSLQDLPSIIGSIGANPEERLAERVLNWLDLAGKTDIVRTQEVETKSNMGRDSVTTTTAGQFRSVKGKAEQCMEYVAPKRFTKRLNTAQHNGMQRVPRRPIATAKQSSMLVQINDCQHNRPDSIKPITIIFNKEGVPVRFNRPARNIDLCALSSSASTTRRLAGQLASARLYNSNSNNAQVGHTGSARGLEECTHKVTPPHSFRSLQDAKKQLHIFMPSLPKKGVLQGSYPSTECDANSSLSHAFTELCQI